MATERQKQIWLGGLVVVLAAFGYRAFSTYSVVPLPAAGGTEPAGPTRRGATASPTAAPDVHLGTLEAEHPQPVPTQRDLFRFKPKPTPAPRLPVAPVAPPAPSGPPPPPPVPPIPYKFIGLVEGSQARRIAVLSDGRSEPVYGREGDIIEGRYRILRIGVESIEMEHLDGRGRQTIRLSGS
jgi:hypothetical protein